MIEIRNGINYIETDKRCKEVVEYVDSVYDNVIVTSGKRSEESNTRCGGAKNSSHLLGVAIDCYVPNVHVCKLATKILEKFPVKGLGIDVYRGLVHFDFRESPTLVTWVYDREGKAI